MDTILQLFTQLNTTAKSNPILAGIISLYGITVLGVIFRSVPSSIYFFIKRQSTTTLSFTSSSVGTNLETFGSFLKWFEKSRWARFSRSISLTGMWTWGSDDKDGTVVGIGEGSHFFIYRGRPCWMTRRRLTDGSQYQLTYEIVITMFGRSRKRIEDMIEEFRYKPDNKKIGVFALHSNEWVRLADVAKRPLKTVIIDRAMKNELVGNIQHWMDSREWYEERGLAYKKTFILKGMPGTGKTSLIKALASHFGMNVCMINLAMMTDNSFERALSTAPKNSFIVIEDFDSSSATKARKSLVTKKVAQPTDKPSDKVELPVSASGELVTKEAAAKDPLEDLLHGGLTLSGILNALDGLLSLDGKIVFMTTNVYETLDPALIRKGRVDHTYELGMLTDPEVRDYVELMFPETGDLTRAIYFAPILGCDLQDLYFQHRNDPAAFVAAIPQTLDWGSMPTIPLRFAPSVAEHDSRECPTEA
jgi:mitochondrial chaperone BCS1